MKQARGGQWNLGILRGDSGEDIREYWGFAPNIGLLVSPESPLKIPMFQCPPLACFIPWIFIPSFYSSDMICTCTCTRNLQYLHFPPPISVRQMQFQFRFHFWYSFLFVGVPFWSKFWLRNWCKNCFCLVPCLEPFLLRSWSSSSASWEPSWTSHTPLESLQDAKSMVSHGKITLFENDAFWYCKVLDVLIGVILAHLGPLWPQNGPQNEPQNVPQMDPKWVQNLFHVWFHFLAFFDYFGGQFWGQKIYRRNPLWLRKCGLTMGKNTLFVKV